MNLRPNHFYRFVPQVYNINSNATIWKMLNRTVYRDASERWLRNEDSRQQLKDKNMPASTREVIRKLIEDYGITHLYSEDMFYKTHKISRSDFLAKLQAASSEQEREQLILSLYDDPAQQGRRGVQTVATSVKDIKKKLDERKKFEKFTQKYGERVGFSVQDLKVPGTSYSSFKDLI